MTASGEDDILSCDAEGELRLWQPHKTDSSLIRSDVNCACFAGSSIVIGTRSGSWSVLSPSFREEEHLVESTEGAPIDVIYHADGLATLEAGRNREAAGTIRLWRRRGKLWQQHVSFEVEADVRSLDFSMTTKRIVCASFGGEVRVFDLDGRPVHRFAAHPTVIWSVRLSPTGDEILTASRDNSAVLWSLRGRRETEFVGHLETVSTAVFSPTGDRVATTSTDGTIRLWSLAGETLAVLRGHRGQVWDAAFSTDGKRLTSGAYDRELRTWPLTHEELLRHARELTAVEIR